jgi:hypothetical protein
MTRPAAAPSGITAGCRVACACASLVLVTLGAGCGAGSPEQSASREPSGAKASVITIALNEENRSGHTGKAVIKPGESGRPGLGGGGGEGMSVTVTLSTPTGESNHAHVHDVTCGEYRNMSGYSERLATITDGLEDLHGGRSDTVVRGVTVGDRTTGHFSINVHKQAHPYDVIACGDIPRAKR